ncbi:MAG: hypothetical protein L6276_03370 [Acetobacterium sp.]|nr:hypothetical protein [uncultured Acetobacterium sp.]MBU4438838.1 hypothetical protein [Bacillota bacterium]MCG2729309.1 hypothetical protein [Acetobacterium sp.]
MNKGNQPYRKLIWHRIKMKKYYKRNSNNAYDQYCNCYTRSVVFVMNHTTLTIIGTTVIDGKAIKIIKE